MHEFPTIELTDEQEFKAKQNADILSAKAKVEVEYIARLLASKASGRKELTVAESVRILFLAGILTNSATDPGRSFLPLA